MTELSKHDAFKQDLSDFDALFDAWKLENPGGSFAEFSTLRTLTGIKKGRAHTTLGPKLTGEKVWKLDGKSAYKNLMGHHYIRHSDRIVDYGCGSLRVSYHFIRFGKSGRWMGLDVQPDFMEYGEDLLGDFKRKKKVRTGTIKEMLDEAVAFDPDVVMSTNVAMHVHPDEQTAFFENQKRMVQRPTSVVIVHAMLSDKAVRFARSGWAWPIEHYDRNFAPLIRIARTEVGKKTRTDLDATSELLTYQMPI